MHISKENALALRNKMEEISALPHVDEVGGSFEGLDFDEDTITYRSSTWCSGCGTDSYYFSFSVDWEDINKPLEYFRKKFEDTANAKEKARRERDKKVVAERKKQEVDDFYKLKAKLGL